MTQKIRGAVSDLVVVGRGIADTRRVADTHTSFTDDNLII